MTGDDPNATEWVHFMCNYCKPKIKKGEMPARCMLNGSNTTRVI